MVPDSRESSLLPSGHGSSPVSSLLGKDPLSWPGDMGTGKEASKLGTGVTSSPATGEASNPATSGGANAGMAMAAGTGE